MPPDRCPVTGELICPDCDNPCTNCTCNHTQPEPCPTCGGPPDECRCDECGQPCCLCDCDDECDGCGNDVADCSYFDDDGEGDDDDIDIDGESTPECPMCDGPSMPIGALGSTSHWRCRNCGYNHFTEASPR